jgi:hypothetical protein
MTNLTEEALSKPRRWRRQRKSQSNHAEVERSR